ncbi:MAG: xanthine dehydrogenase family protein molybdopterin-binding subunit [Actinomycetota bacterium]
MASTSIRDILAGDSFERASMDELLAGGTAYVSDLRIEGCLEAAFARSWEAHGSVQQVDVGKARRLVGVTGAYAASHLPDLPVTPAPPVDVIPDGMERQSLAREKVRYAGEPVAVVLAEDRYVAEDAVESIFMDIESLPVVMDPHLAAADDVRLFDAHSNVVFERTVGVEDEELERVLRGAAVSVTVEIRNERLSPLPLESRAIAIVPEGRKLTVFCSHQAPHRLKAALVTAFSLEEDEVRIVVPHVGGAFGQKSHTFPEYIVLAHLASLLQRPVRWVEDRRESFVASTHGRGQSQTIRLAADGEGKLLAMDARIDADVGAYPHTGAMVPLFTSLVMSGPYKIPYMSVRARAIVTNACPAAPYRGAGRPEAAYAVERAMDELAYELNMDPTELRTRNFIPSAEMPYESPTGALYDSGDYLIAFEKALELADYAALKRRKDDRREGVRFGIGLCSYIERSGGQSGSTEFGEVEVLADGRVIVRSGSMSTGQNHQAAMAEIVASALDLDPTLVSLQQGDTSQVASGTGSFASRTMQVGGAAANDAAREVLGIARARAADELEVDPADLTYAGGYFSVAGAGERKISLAELAGKERLFASTESIARQAFPYGSYVAGVEIDEGTGKVTVERLVAVEDCGVVIDMESAEDQVVGSIAQGLGQALLEGCVYDESGQPLTASMMDYLIPTAADVPRPELAHTVTPSPFSSIGAKGIGEAGCIGVPPAIANAIADALGIHGARLDPPFTPESVWRMMSGSRS